MPKPQPQQATWAPRLSIPSDTALRLRGCAAARRWLSKACESVAQALDHEGKSDATGTEVVTHLRERAMPKPQPQQATWVPRLSVPTSLAHKPQHSTGLTFSGLRS